MTRVDEQIFWLRRSRLGMLSLIHSHQRIWSMREWVGNQVFLLETGVRDGSRGQSEVMEETR